MIVIKDPSEVGRIADKDIRALVTQRFMEICDGAELSEDEPFDSDNLGYMIVVESGDSVASLEQESGCPILHNYLAPDIHFGSPNFVPTFEILEQHSWGYELVYILGGDFGISLFIPSAVDGVDADLPAIDADLLAMCKKYAVPVTM